MGLTKSEVQRLSPAAQAQIRAAEKRQREPKTPEARKYKNLPCDYTFPDGRVEHFDSMKERDRYASLVLLQEIGSIKGLRRQVEYLLIPSHKRSDGSTERSCKYVADFVYEEDGVMVVEDVKGYRDPKSAGYAKFVIKRKLMLDRFGITVREV